jgi:hypothetical protein
MNFVFLFIVVPQSWNYMFTQICGAGKTKEVSNRPTAVDLGPAIATQY